MTINSQLITYDQHQSLRNVLDELRHLPPLVTPNETNVLLSRLAKTSDDRPLVLHMGDCAELFSDCRETVVRANASLFLAAVKTMVSHTRREVICIARAAGQYAK